MTNLRNYFAKYRALPPAHQRLLAKSAILLPFFWIGLHLAGLRRMQAWLARVQPKEREALSLEEVMAMGRVVNAAARLAPCPVTCLTRSLLLDWLLRRRGAASRLRIGVRLDGGTLDAHAWVELNGVPVNDRCDIGSEFAPFADLPPPATFHSP